MASCAAVRQTRAVRTAPGKAAQEFAAARRCARSRLHLRSRSPRKYRTPRTVGAATKKRLFRAIHFPAPRAHSAPARVICIDSVCRHLVLVRWLTVDSLDCHSAESPLFYIIAPDATGHKGIILCPLHIRDLYWPQT